MGEELERKIRGIVGLYRFYRVQLTTVQRIALLTIWIETCISKEEYEVANALQKEMDIITKGEEEYVFMVPTSILGIQEFVPPTIDEMKHTIVTNMDAPKKTKKIKWVNHWGSGNFHVFNLTFGEFKFILFNIGWEMK